MEYNNGKGIAKRRHFPAYFICVNSSARSGGGAKKEFNELYDRYR